MIKLIILIAITSWSAYAQETIKSLNLNDFKIQKESEANALNSLRIQKSAQLTNQGTRANAVRTVYAISQYIDYANSSWFYMNNLNALPATDYFCETTFDTTNGNTVGGKMTYIFSLVGGYNDNPPVAKGSNITFTAKKTTITAVSMAVETRTGQVPGFVRFHMVGDDSAATFNTKCVQMQEGI